MAAKKAAKRKASKAAETFPDRLARLRNDAGFTQRELAKELGISQRMVAYYETQDEPPLVQLLVTMVEVLGVTADELLGVTHAKTTKPNQRLWRRFRQLEKLPAKERKQLLSVVDAYLERDKLSRRAS